MTRADYRAAVFVIAIISGLVARNCRAWTIEPVDVSGQVGWSLSLDSDSAGSPQAAFFTTSPNGDYRYTKRTASGWQQQAVIDSASAFALDHNGTPFFVSTPSPNFYPQFQTVLSNGMVLGQQLAATRISDTVFLDFDSQNRPQVGWLDYTAVQLKHSFWNGASWTTRTVATSSQLSSGSQGFVATLDSNDQMHFAWQDGADHLQYAKPNGTTWQISTPFPTLSASPLDMAVDSAGKVHLAYDVFTGNLFTGGLFYSSLSGSTWTGGRIPGLDAFGAERSKVVVDSSNQPHLFTYDSTFSGPEKLKHFYRDSGGNWTSETIDQYTNTSSGPEDIEATYDSNGFHVLYSTSAEKIYYASQSVGIPGDFDSNGAVDMRDYVVWRNGLGTTYTQADYNTWRSHFGQTAGGGAGAVGIANVPEPAAGSMLLVGMVIISARRLRSAS